jgi:hypothetical protein
MFNLIIIIIFFFFFFLIVIVFSCCRLVSSCRRRDLVWNLMGKLGCLIDILMIRIMFVCFFIFIGFSLPLLYVETAREYSTAIDMIAA